MAEQEVPDEVEVTVVAALAPTEVPQPMPTTVVVTVAVGFAAMDRAIEAQRMAFRGLGTLAGGLRRSLVEVERRVGWQDRPAVPPGLQQMADAGRESGRGLLRDLESVADRVVRAVVGFVLDRVDVNEIITRVDFDAVIDQIDLSEVAGRVIDELDLTAIVGRVLDELDLTPIARRVMDELDLPVIIRESTGAVTVETVDAIRMGGANADRALSRAIDRLLRRRIGRDLHPNGDGHAATATVEVAVPDHVETAPAEPAPEVPEPAPVPIEPVPVGTGPDGATA